MCHRPLPATLQMFSVAMIGVAFIPMACNSSSRFPAYPEGAAVLYPPKQCSDLRVHVAPAVIMLAIQIPMVLVLAIKDCQLDPLARNAIAVAGPGEQPDSTCTRSENCALLCGSCPTWLHAPLPPLCAMPERQTQQSFPLSQRPSFASKLSRCSRSSPCSFFWGESDF